MLQTNITHQFLTPTLFTLQSYYFFYPRKLNISRVEKGHGLLDWFLGLKHTVEE